MHGRKTMSIKNGKSTTLLYYDLIIYHLINCLPDGARNNSINILLHGHVGKFEKLKVAAC